MADLEGILDEACSWAPFKLQQEANPRLVKSLSSPSLSTVRSSRRSKTQARCLARPKSVLDVQRVGPRRNGPRRKPSPSVYSVTLRTSPAVSIV